MKKHLTKFIGITLLIVSMILTNFPACVKAAEKTNASQGEQGQQSVDISKDSTKDNEKFKEIKIPKLNTNDITQGNNYPIVLVHGFLGYGRDELLGYKYWGGFTDLEKELRNSGHETYTATVGPVSSNWDRACELYAYIVGGTVDYGEAHSKKFGHSRYGKTYPGLYKNISDKNKIHLIGHSMGGQTVRTITQLLSEGSEEEKNCGQNKLSPLFEGGKHWIHSVTTIATPNDGTTLADALSGRKMLSSVFGALDTIVGHDTLQSSVYDFKLDQWGLQKRQGESNSEYIDRMLNNEIWSQTNDIATYDLSTEGARELNKWVKAQPDVYYFSWVTCATSDAFIGDTSIPEVGPMNPMFYVNARIMGTYTRNKGGAPIIDKKWFPNDGVVNSYSQDGPKLGSEDVIKKFNGQAEKGKWNVMPKLVNVDHMDIVGTFGNVKDWYIDYAEQLNSLPQ